MTRDEILKLCENEKSFLMKSRTADGCWLGELSSSAVSTATAAYALHMYDKALHAPEISGMLGWLVETQNPDGGWGDTPESPSNMSASILSACALFPYSGGGKFSGAFARAKKHLEACCDFSSPKKFAASVLKYYGSDLTFSAPILAMCSSSGIAGGASLWRHVPRLPFELAALPQGLFGLLKLPMVSYAIPALVAIGLARASKCGPLGRLSKFWFKDGLLRKISKMQPSSGGYLEAAPLSAFCTICLCEAGLGDSQICARAVDFLLSQIRPDGSCPIDRDLGQWLTSLASSALSADLPEKISEKLCDIIISRQFGERHAFTNAAAGAWGWTDTDGAVPDSDDTSAALCALHALGCEFNYQAVRGLDWLMDLQNSDGGMPTFCKGWNRLPFDRSCADISAHALKAFRLWAGRSPEKFAARLEKASGRLEKFLEVSQNPDGSWVCLWFGDQDCPGGAAPVYGTSIVLQHLGSCGEGCAFARRAAKYLADSQNADGGWGGLRGVPSKNLVTARAVAALANYPEHRGAFMAGLEALAKFDARRSEPVGLYFSKLWYSEKLYPPILRLAAFTEALKIVK